MSISIEAALRGLPPISRGSSIETQRPEASQDIIVPTEPFSDPDSPFLEATKEWLIHRRSPEQQIAAEHVIIEALSLMEKQTDAYGPIEGFSYPQAPPEETVTPFERNAPPEVKAAIKEEAAYQPPPDDFIFPDPKELVSP